MRLYVRFIVLTLCFAVCGFFTACDTPIGLGKKVNTSVPVITIPDDETSQPGSFLTGDGNTIYLDVTQEFGIDSVYMEIDYVDLDGVKRTERVPAYWDNEKGAYAVDIDTIKMRMADGTIKTRVTAIDVTGNKTTTTDIIYTIKNLPPQIELSIPAVKGDDFDDPDLNTVRLADDPVFLGYDLMGLASDNLGIAEGYPKIMIWPVLSHLQVDEDGIPTDARYGTWRSVVLPNPRPGLTATRFSWPMVDLIEDAAAEGGYRLPRNDERYEFLPPGKYRFRILTKDLNGKENCYPNRTDNKRGPDGTPADPATLDPKYMEIDYLAADIPIITIRNIPPYYNGVGDFTVNFLVNSQNELVSVTASIATDDTEGPGQGSPYSKNDYIKWTMPETGFMYTCSLTVPQTEAAHWPKPEDGTLFVYISATDVLAKTSPPASRNFIYDVEPPEVTFDRPTVIVDPKATGILEGGSYAIYYPTNPPRWVTGEITAGGSSRDSFGIDKVYYHIGKLNDDKATDEQRKEIYANADWEDTGLHSLTPKAGWSGSVYAWTYTYNFNSFKPQTGIIQEHTDLVGLSDPVYETTDRTRFYLPFYVKVLDIAGNYRIVHYKLCIDPDLDIPQVDISYPTGIEPVGGEVRLSGTASDNNWIHTVQIRITKAPDEEGAPTEDYYIPVGAVWFYDETEGWPDYPDGGDREGWFKANKIGDDMVVGWFYNINGDNGLNPVSGDSVKVKIEVRAIDTKDYYHSEPHLVGPATTLNVQFNTGVPSISNPDIKKAGVEDRAYFEGMRASGNFTVSMKLSDDRQIRNVKARFNGAAYTDLISNYDINPSLPNGWSISDTYYFDPDDPMPKGPMECTLTIVIDTTNITAYPLLGYGKTGTLNLDVLVEDNSNTTYRTTKSFNIGVDNFYPVTDIETQSNAAGTAFAVKGTARDYGTGSGSIQGLERVLVYFEKAAIVYNNTVRTVSGTGVYLNPRGKIIGTDGDVFYNKSVYMELAPGGPGLTWHTQIPPLVEYPNVRDYTQPENSSGPNFPNAANFNKFPLLRLIDKGGNIGEVWESPHAMVIDYQELGETTEIDGDGTFGEVWSGMVDKDWQGRLNTELFGDGPLMVHYIVMDQAGNAAHYQKDIYIENNKPQIESINLGTDIDGDGAVDSGEFMQHEFPVGLTTSGNSKIAFNPPFRIQNSRFRISLKTTGGNPSKHYRVSYVTEGGAIPATQMQRGRVYTIATSGATDWEMYGAPNNMVGTTFVASGPGQGNGSVTQYTEGGVPQTGSFSNAQNFDNIIFGGTDFAGITDSTAQNDRLFIVKVYDSTVAGTGITEYDQLAHAVLVAVNIENTDTHAPAIHAAPFGKEYVLNTSGSTDPANDADKILENVSNYTNNIVMSDTREGYVQYAEHSTSSHADISGKVKFLGKAADNQRIQNITVAITGFRGGAPFTVAQWVSGSRLVSNRDTMGTGTDAWSFKIIDQHLTLDHGHVLNWEFAWDSSEVAGVTRDNVTVTFRVNDFRTGSPAPGQDQLAVNIAPYILEVETGLNGAYSANPSAFNRSARGKYPVRENETITIKGFNLFNETPNETADVKLNGEALTAAGTPTKSKIGVSVGTTATSGPLVVTVGGIASLNNRNHATATYNQEPNGLNNNTLNDDRELYVWSTGYLHNSRDLHSPFMRLDDSGNRYMSYGTYVGQNGYFNVRKNDAQTQVENFNNRYKNTTITPDTAGDWYAAGTNYTASTDASFTFYARAQATNANGTAGTNKRIIMRITNGGLADADRFEIPRIFVQHNNGTSRGTNNAGTRILMSYYDNNSNENPVLFKYGVVGDNLTTNANGFGNLATNNAAATFADSQVVANNTSTHRSGKYTAVGALSNGLPVIAWYDKTNQNMVFSHANQLTTPLSAGTTAQVEVNTSVNFSTNLEEYVYTAAGHGLTAGTATANSVLVDNTRYYVRRARTADKFVLDTNQNATTANNNIGKDAGATITVVPYGANATRTAGTLNTNNPQGVTGTYSSYRWENNGLALGDKVRIVNGNNIVQDIYYVVLRFGTNNRDLKFASAYPATNATMYNTNAAIDIYPMDKNGIDVTIKPTRGTESYYTPNTNLAVGRIVTVAGNQYTVAEVWTGNNTGNFKLADTATGAIVTIPSSTDTVNVTADAVPIIVTTSTDDWQANAVVIKTSAGTHVDMAVDKDNNIHLAYYDVINGGLWYTYIPVTGSGLGAMPNKANRRTVRVDTYLSAGTKLMINVRREGSRNMPYISYYHASFAETRNAIRVAWPVNPNNITDGTNADDSFTGAWEVMTVPTGTVPVNEFVTNGVPTGEGTAWATGSFLQARDLSKTILVGYMTTDFYEGAVLKADLYP